MNTLRALVFVLTLMLPSCAGGVDATSTVSAGDASADAGYGGGGSVIPTFGADARGGAAPGSTPYGPDGGGLSPCPRDTGAAAPKEAAAEGAAVVADAAPDARCSGGLAPGDLAIDELMIASAPGGGDHGEWVEVASTRDCELDLKGLYAEVPHGAGSTLASFTSDVVLPPHGYFVIADSADATDNHGLPGLVVTWGSGTSSDVLLNSGDTITLYTSAATIDALTYPNPSKMIEGASMAFPSNCDPSLRTAFGNWQPSVASWTPGFFGTPSRPNDDVSCPVGPPGPPTPGGSPCDGP